VRAGADPNNDGTVCGPGEPCGAWTTSSQALSTERAVSLSLPEMQATGTQSGLDLSLSPAPWGP